MRRISLVLIAVLAVLALAALPGGAVPPTGGPPGQLHKSPPPTTCDPIDASQCLLPFPDNYFTTCRRVIANRTSPRPSRPTSMPANAQGVHIDPTDWDQSDGFSPGSAIIAFIPGLDLHATGAAPITDIARSLDANAPIVLLDTNTGERVPYWAELDTWDPNPATKALVIRPAAQLRRRSSHRRRAAQPQGRGGQRHSGVTGVLGLPRSPAEHGRRPCSRVGSRSTAWFSDLEPTGVRRQSLNLAWDFTVASQQGLSGRMLHIRDDAYAH